MFFLNVARSFFLGRAAHVLPAAVPTVLHTVPSSTTSTTRGCRRSQFQHSANREDWSPSSTDLFQPLPIRNGAIVRTSTVNMPRHTRSNTQYHMITHDEDGPLGSALEHDFLGTIWIRDSSSSRVVRRSARIRQLTLNVKI